MTAVAYYSVTQAQANLATVQTIRTRYRDELEQAARLTNVPTVVIESILFIESGGNASAISSAGAVGLMQITPDSAVTAIHLDLKGDRVNDEQQDILYQAFGKKFLNMKKLKFLGDTKAGTVKPTAQELLTPRVNLMIGGMMLGRLIDQSTDVLNVTDRLVRWDKVVVRYNSGYFYRPKANTVAAMIAEARKRGGAETANYITKFVGKNGLLPTLT